EVYTAPARSAPHLTGKITHRDITARGFEVNIVLAWDGDHKPWTVPEGLPPRPEPEAARCPTVNLHVGTVLGKFNHHVSGIRHFDVEACQRICWPHVDGATIGFQEQPAAGSDLKRLGDRPTLFRSRMHNGNTPQHSYAPQDRLNVHL